MSDLPGALGGPAPVRQRFEELDGMLGCVDQVNGVPAADAEVLRQRRAA